MDNLILRFSSGSPRFQVCKDHISFTNQFCVLGPRYLEKKAGQLISYELHDARAPLPLLISGGVSWANWVKYLPRFYPKVEIKGCEMSWATWVKRMEPKFRDSWISNGTYHAIMCSTIQLQPDEALLSSALMFWNSASNTFDFGVGPMSISILDLAVVFGFRPHGRSADCLADFERTPEENGQMGLRIDDMTRQINVNRAFGLFMKNFQGVESADPQVEHMMFLLYWLRRFIFPNASGNITLEWIHLAEALAYHSDVAIGPLLLASIYRCLRDITVVPFNMNVNGPLWMVQVWLQWQFPELRASQLEFAEDKAPLEQLLSSPISGRTTEECFTFFLSKRARSPDQWKMSMRRNYPWFMGTSFHQGPKDASKPLAYENMSIFSCLKGRDLLLGGRQVLRHYTYGVEAYCPQFFSRQFGWPQVIPEMDYSLLNRGSSFRTSDFLRDDLLRVRNKYKTAAQSQELKPYQPDFNCTDAFQKWWAEYSRRLSTSCTKLTYDEAFFLCPFEKKLSHEARLSLNDRLEEENRHLMTLAADCWVFPPASSSTENAQQGEAVPAAPARAPIFFQRKHKMGKTAPAASPILKSNNHSKAAETESSFPPPTVSKRTKQFGKGVRSPQTKTASNETANTEGLGEPNSDGDGRSGKKARTSTEEPDEPSTAPGVFTSSVGHMVAAIHTILVQLDRARGGSVLNTLPISQVKEGPSGPVVLPFPGASKAPLSSTALTTNPTEISDGKQPSNSPIEEGQDGETGAEPSSPILAISAEAFNADPFSEEGNDAPSPVAGNAEPDLDQLLKIITEQNFEQSTPQLLLCSEPAFPDVSVIFGLPRSLFPTINLWRIDRALVTGPSGSTTEGRAEDILVLALEVPEAVVNLDALQVQNSENLVQDSPLSALTPASSCPIVVEKDSVLEVFQEKPQMEDVSKEEARSIVDNWMLAPLNMRTGEDALRNVSQALQVFGQFYPRLRTTLEKAAASLDSLPGRLREFNSLCQASASLWKIQLQLDQEEKTQEQRLLRAKEVKEDLARMDSRLSNSEAGFCQLINSKEAAIEKAVGTFQALEYYQKSFKILDADFCKLLRMLKRKDMMLREILLDLGHFSSLSRDFLLTM